MLVQDEDAVTQIHKKSIPDCPALRNDPVNVEKNLRKVIEIFLNYGDRSFYDEIAGYSSAKPAHKRRIYRRHFFLYLSVLTRL